MSQYDEYKQVAAQFGSRLAALRAEANMSQNDLAAAIDVDRTYISLLERGLRTPTLKRLWMIAKVLNKSLAELVTF